jgi:hypothetical protein
MDFELRNLERQASDGDLEAKELLYHRYRRLGASHLGKLCAMLAAEITARSQGRNRGCFPLLSFDWKDADLEPDGCTGIRGISCSPTNIQVTVSGHKTFAPDEEGLNDDGYLAALYDTFTDITMGYEGDWTGDEWQSSYTNTIKVEYQPELSDTVIYLIEQAETDLMQYKEDMTNAHEAFYAVEFSTPTDAGVCEICGAECEYQSDSPILCGGDECLNPPTPSRRNPDNEIRRLERMAQMDPSDSEIAGRLEAARQRAGKISCQHCGETVAADDGCEVAACRYKRRVDYYLDGVNYFSPGVARNCAGCATEDMDADDYEELEAGGEPFFSHYPCEICSSSLGGDRHPAHGFLENEDEIQHFDICTDCFNYFHFGETPEDY